MFHFYSKVRPVAWYWSIMSYDSLPSVNPRKKSIPQRFLDHKIKTEKYGLKLGSPESLNDQSAALSCNVTFNLRLSVLGCLHTYNFFSHFSLFSNRNMFFIFVFQFTVRARDVSHSKITNRNRKSVISP